MFKAPTDADVAQIMAQRALDARCRADLHAYLAERQRPRDLRPDEVDAASAWLVANCVMRADLFRPDDGAYRVQVAQFTHDFDDLERKTAAINRVLWPQGWNAEFSTTDGTAMTGWRNGVRGGDVELFVQATRVWLMTVTRITPTD